MADVKRAILHVCRLVLPSTTSSLPLVPHQAGQNRKVDVWLPLFSSCLSVKKKKGCCGFVVWANPLRKLKKLSVTELLGPFVQFQVSYELYSVEVDDVIVDFLQLL